MHEDGENSESQYRASISPHLYSNRLVLWTDLFVQRGLYPEPAMFQFSAAQHEEDTDDGSEAECEDEETPGGQQLCEVLPQLVAALTHWTMDCLHASRCPWCAISKDP